MYDAFKLLYFSWILLNLISGYNNDLSKIYNKYNITGEDKSLINAIQHHMKKKFLTDDGKDLKERIITKAFYKNNDLIWYLTCRSLLYCYLNHLFSSLNKKNLTCINYATVYHKLFAHFFSCCMVFESIPVSSNKLEPIGVPSNACKLKNLFLGNDNNQLFLPCIKIKVNMKL